MRSLFYSIIFVFIGSLGFVDAAHKSPKTKKGYYDFYTNPHITSWARGLIEPYLLPSEHPIKPILDDIFFSQRATADAEALARAGFVTKFIQPRSFIRVLSHPLMPGYLFKVYLDSELRQKYNKPGWYWFVMRCKGTKKIKKIIQKRNIRHFVWTDKWIYPLPRNPSPPRSSKYKRQLAILVVKDMELAGKPANLFAWKNKITKSHIRELHTIISYAGGSSYRPDNIPYTIHGKFAFIDTEYPQQVGGFDIIKFYLSDSMRAYLEKLCSSPINPMR